MNDEYKSPYERARIVFDRIVWDLERFEEKHQMTSDEFARKFSNAELPEEEDFFDWRIKVVAFRRMVAKFGFRRATKEKKQ